MPRRRRRRRPAPCSETGYENGQYTLVLYNHAVLRHETKQNYSFLTSRSIAKTSYTIRSLGVLLQTGRVFLMIFIVGVKFYMEVSNETSDKYMHKVIVKNPIVQMSHFTSLMHHFNTPRARMCSPDQCSTYHASKLPPFASSYYKLLEQKVPAGYNGHMHKMCLHWDHTYEHLYDYG